MGKQRPSIELATPKHEMMIQDWENREFLNIITDRIEKMTKILAKIELTCKTKIRMFEERILYAEKQVDYLESLFEHDDSEVKEKKVVEKSLDIPPPPPRAMNDANEIATVAESNTAVERADEALPDFEQFPIPPEDFLD